MRCQTMRSWRSVNGTRGNVVILFAVLLPVLLGCMALGVDSGVVGAAGAQMQTATDAAALAGAYQLMDNRLPFIADTMMSQARSKATEIANANKVMNEQLVMIDNPTNSTSGQIVVGYTSPTDYTTPIANLPDTTAATSTFNSVKVTACRDSQHGGPLPSFFSSVLGFHSTPLTTSSLAVMEVHDTVGFRANGSLNADLLPIVLDVNTYNQMISGTTTDQYTWNESTKTVTSGPDGVMESLLYPVKNGNPGNWGTIKVGVSNNSTATLGAQIRYGITPAQLATFSNSTIALDSSMAPPSITFSGNPGISAGIKDDLASIIGKPVFIPIYDQTGGNGNNAWYHVVKFAGCRILSVNFKGNPKYVIIQPAEVLDPTGIPGVAQPIVNGGLVRIHLAR